MSAYTRRQILQASLATTVAAAAPVGPVAAAGFEAPQAEAPKEEEPIKTRMFWTWDHSTEWALNIYGAQTFGASNEYTRPGNAFVEDYTNLLQWCGRHNINGVVLWGLLRDVHGGLDSAKKLVDVSSKQGVRILGGVGLNAYGGVYYQGNSPYSLDQHLEAHPELNARDVHGNRMPRRACPSRPENQEFIARSLRWLFTNLSLGGVQIETGDYGVCRCELCEKRRHHPVFVFSWEDMALMYPIAAEAIRSVSPDAWIVCETYSHPEPYAGSQPAPTFGDGKPAWADECLARFPKGKGIFVQWVCDNFVKPKSLNAWTKAGTVSGTDHHNVMRAHLGTYWLDNQRGELSIDWIADMVQRSITHGFDAISLFGEVSPFDTGAELNYLALMNYGSAANPHADLDVFLRDVAAPLLGGEKYAHDYLRYARLLGDRPQISSRFEGNLRSLWDLAAGCRSALGVARQLFGFVCLFDIVILTTLVVQALSFRTDNHL